MDARECINAISTFANSDRVDRWHAERDAVEALDAYVKQRVQECLRELLGVGGKETDGTEADHGSD